MESTKLLGLVNKIDNSKNIGATCRHLSITDKQLLEEATTFLPTTSNISRRLWHIRHNIPNLILCSECNLPVKWKSGNTGYHSTCSYNCSRNSKNYIEKRTKSYINKLGVAHPSQSNIIKEKKKQTMLFHYGVEYPFQSKIIQNNMKNTWIIKYGVDNPRKSKEIQEKIKQTNLEKYGSHYTQQHMIDILPLINDPDWLFDQYITQNKTAWQIGKENNISDVTIGNYLKTIEIEIKYTTGYSHKCISWLESIMDQKGINIQHALNGGEFRFDTDNKRVKADGYCSDTNTIYEFHGDIFHGNPEIFAPNDCPNFYRPTTPASILYQETIEKENRIRTLGYNLIVIWEKEFIQK